jgi:hypothetical protein
MCLWRILRIEMATTAQILANRSNAELSTGPKTDAGKAAAAQNSTSHGLSSARFALLPNEDPQAYRDLLASLVEEHEPQTPTERFLVMELAQSQWKIHRAEAIEAELLNVCSGDTTWAAVAEKFQSDCASAQALLKLGRYQAAARRTWQKALDTLTRLRFAAKRNEALERSETDFAAMIDRVVHAPVPAQARPQNENCETKPMPLHLQRELDSHRRRDPLFDPKMDRSQMSRELQKWFSRHAA